MNAISREEWTETLVGLIQFPEPKLIKQKPEPTTKRRQSPAAKIIELARQRTPVADIAIEVSRSDQEVWRVLRNNGRFAWVDQHELASIMRSRETAAAIAAAPRSRHRKGTCPTVGRIINLAYKGKTQREITTTVQRHQSTVSNHLNASGKTLWLSTEEFTAITRFRAIRAEKKRVTNRRWREANPERAKAASRKSAADSRRRAKEKAKTKEATKL